jgi:hypothetical protein
MTDDLRKSWGFISSKGDADLEKEWSDLGEDEENKKNNNLERSEPLPQSNSNNLSQSPTKDTGKKEDKTKQKFLNFVLNGRNRFLNTFYNLYNSQPTDAPIFTSSPIWLFGKKYEMTPEEVTASANKKKAHQYPHAQRFIQDFANIVWFTYRKDFPELQQGPYSVTSDIGWGCMVRSGQMVLAQALMNLFESTGLDADRKSPYSTYRQVLRWFSDNPSTAHPYSIHNIIARNAWIKRQRAAKYNVEYVEKTEEYLYKGGNWLAPSEICQILEILIRRHSPEGLVMNVPSQGVVYIDQILVICSSKPASHMKANQTNVHSNFNNNNTNNGREGVSDESEEYTSGEEDVMSQEEEDFLKNQRKSLTSSDPYPLLKSSLKEKKKKNENNGTNGTNGNAAKPRSRKSSRGEADGVVVHANKNSAMVIKETESGPVIELDDLTGLSTQKARVTRSTSKSKVNGSLSSSPSSKTTTPLSRSPSKNSGLPPLVPQQQAQPQPSTQPNGDQLPQAFWRPLLLIVPTRLGIDKLNKTYIPHLKACLECPFTVGIIGGKPNKSLYFVGYQDEEVVYLDPHVVRPAVKPDQDYSVDVLDSYHCKVPQRMNFEDVDPSLAVGFLLKTREEFFKFIDFYYKWEQKNVSLVFTVETSSPEHELEASMHASLTEDDFEPL